MSRRNGVLVVQLDAQAVSRTTNKREVRRAEHERENVGFQAASVNQSVEEMRERCNTKTENTARTEAVRDEDRGGGRCRTREARA